ncbi:MAG TPA: hypothetical protein VEF04_19220, partial [Blastocatellia bacterium]|nr:hypothetical protein [Blastocatellia bacterium]
MNTRINLDEVKANVKVNIKTFLLALTMVLLPSLASIAKACTCGQISPCEAYANASVVFVGLVSKTATESTKSGRLPSNEMSTTLASGNPVARFKVEEAFLG